MWSASVIVVSELCAVCVSNTSLYWCGVPLSVFSVHCVQFVSVILVPCHCWLVAWKGPLLERNVERVAVRQDGHWPCGCSHTYLILFHLRLLHNITQTFGSLMESYMRWIIFAIPAPYSTFGKDDLMVNWPNHVVKGRIKIKTHIIVFVWNLKLFVFF
jgi:hypothetical protein